MSKRSNGRDSKEFRSEAVKLVVESGVSVYEASRQLCLMQEARFWGAALGCPLPKDAQAQAHDRFIQLGTKPGEVQIILQQVAHDPRVHLDMEMESIEDEVNRLKKLGDIPVSHHDGWTVMQAPSGHRFCVGKRV